MSTEEYKEMVDKIDSDGENLNPWEVDFIESMVVFFQNDPNGVLTPRQQETIRRIHTQRVG